MATKTRLTAEEFWRLGAPDVRQELVNGEIVTMTVTGGLHGQYVAEVSCRLGDHVRSLGGGKVFAGDTGFILQLSADPERVRAPDVAYVSSARLPGGKVPAKFIPCAPDLAVEVLSPSESGTEIQQKVRDYLEAGSRLVWVFAPEAKSVTVYRPDGSARLLRENDTLDGEDVLPGLVIPLSELFS